MKLYTVITPCTTNAVTTHGHMSLEKVFTFAPPTHYTASAWHEYLVNFDGYAKPGNMIIHSDRVIVCHAL